jgi:hypothetical protein
MLRVEKRPVPVYLFLYSKVSGKGYWTYPFCSAKIRTNLLRKAGSDDEKKAI